MATEKHQETAQEYFAANPGEDVIHITSDGQVFFQKNYNDAVNHQRRIDEKTKIVTIYRKQKSVEVEGGNDDNLPNDKWKNAEIAEWLNVAGVETTGKETKAELLAKVADVAAEEDGEGKEDDND